MVKYKPKITTLDLFRAKGQDGFFLRSNQQLQAGSNQHIYLIDLINAIQDPAEEEMILLKCKGYTNDEIAKELNVSRWVVSRKISALKRRAD